MILVTVFAANPWHVGTTLGSERQVPADVDRSPVDVALSHDGRWLVSANETSASVSLIDVASERVIDEVLVGDHPAKVQFIGDSNELLVSCKYSGQLFKLKIDDGKLHTSAVIDVADEPMGIAISGDGRTAFVGLTASASIAQVDLTADKVVGHLQTGNWPRYLALSPDGKRLAVGCGGDGTVEVFDAHSGEALYDEPLANGLNLGHMVTSPDNQYVYFTWMVYRTNPINERNIRLGWVLASRIGRVRLDGPSYREAISLDVPGLAVADPHGIAISPNQNHLVASASGTHELLVYRLPDLPFVATGGPGDLIDRELERDRERFYRIDLGGRPMGLVFAADNRTVYVANYLSNEVQCVDLESAKITRRIGLGGPKTPSLQRRGMAVFYDGTRSLDQWYSCHSCHQDGGISSRPMDTWNDGTPLTLKTAPPLYQLDQTGPWTWHGWQENLNDAMHKSFTSTMQGKAPSDSDAKALLAFLSQLTYPPNPFVGDDHPPSEAAQRGKALFESSSVGCADCHNGPFFSDGQIHDVGLGSKDDAYDGFNTPSLRGTFRKVRWLHNGRAKTLHRVLSDLHSPEKVSGKPKLTEQQIEDLIAYLRTL